MSSTSTVVNTVSLVGRVSADPEDRELPSGDHIVTFRLVVPRDRAARRRSRQVVDVIECVAWSSRLRTTAARLRADDTVEVSGALRRRFSRASGAASSWVSVELTACRRTSGTRG
ncbi:single-stranded DNA-binding protein [Aeromicrobium sp. CF4.19]|uniref:single-stranded DNA-binding protein n=1 Tax=Aeromicrobium sp. CF4.19 TaxID=3373082 RepID=UPI003EE4537B